MAVVTDIRTNYVTHGYSRLRFIIHNTVIAISTASQWRVRKQELVAPLGAAPELLVADLAQWV